MKRIEIDFDNSVIIIPKGIVITIKDLQDIISKLDINNHEWGIKGEDDNVKSASPFIPNIPNIREIEFPKTIPYPTYPWKQGDIIYSLVDRT